MAPYHLENAKLAGKKSYRIKANWKLTLENYLECYHCGPSHKEYAKSHTLREEPDVMEARHNPAMRERALKAGYGPGLLKDVYSDFAVSTDFGCEVHHGRYALYEGFKTGSLDGDPVAPLMGDFEKIGYDGGAGDFCIGPLNYMLNYPDHCVLYRFLPISLQESECFISWFVDGDANEGTDYDPERVMKLWDHTTCEDEFIIMRNHEGVNTSFFEPGPYSPIFETLCMDFVEWYLKALAR
jgi:Rieske 2Fe-2S family protein